MFARRSRSTGQFIRIQAQVNVMTMPVPEPVFCKQTDHCEGCPYPAHGFICWHGDGSCMRTDEEKRCEREVSALG